MMLRVLLVSMLMLNASCAGSDIRVNAAAGSIEGVAPGQTVISLFDGSELKRVNVKAGRFNISHGVSKGYYGVIFIMQRGFLPEALLFKAEDRTHGVRLKALNKIEGSDYGVLAGVVYTPVMGGKLQEHNGIARLFNNENIRIVKGAESFAVVADERGIFRIPLAKGEYVIVIDGKEVDRITIEPGITTIKNLRKGLVLMD